jgi:hypothetical protein
MQQTTQQRANEICLFTVNSEYYPLELTVTKAKIVFDDLFFIRK